MKTRRTIYQDRDRAVVDMADGSYEVRWNCGLAGFALPATTEPNGDGATAEELLVIARDVLADRLAGVKAPEVAAAIRLIGEAFDALRSAER